MEYSTSNERDCSVVCECVLPSLADDGGSIREEDPCCAWKVGSRFDGDSLRGCGCGFGGNFGPVDAVDVAAREAQRRRIDVLELLEHVHARQAHGRELERGSAHGRARPRQRRRCVRDGRHPRARLRRLRPRTFACACAAATAVRCDLRRCGFGAGHVRRCPRASLRVRRVHERSASLCGRTCSSVVSWAPSRRVWSHPKKVARSSRVHVPARSVRVERVR
mmetsp:Transcript_26325/g.86398  ORF Transcript_26325/g.86398 Transcript_26325/m.86398 type:complete len:221 (+) Transcript_26325:1355-2017(+)